MPFTVSPAAAADVPAACALLFPGPPRGVDPAGLFVAKAGGAVCGAVLAQPLPGAVGLVWPPRATDPAAADALAAAAAAHLRAAGVAVGEAFTAPHDRAAAAPLERHGFRHVTRLTFLRRDLAPADARLRDAARPPLRLVPFGEDPPAFRAALLATHTGSRDCPEMNAGRTPQELVDGFAPPAGGPDGFWFLARTAAGEPVGVLLLDRGAAPDEPDVVYLGLTPAARGRGFGDELVRFALGRAARGGARAVNLTVDARNDPALGLYRRHGFRAYDSRDVFLAVW